MPEVTQQFKSSGSTIMASEQCVAMAGKEEFLTRNLALERIVDRSLSPRIKRTPSGLELAVSSSVVLEHLHRSYREGTILEGNITFSISSLRPLLPWGVYTSSLVKIELPPLQEAFPICRAALVPRSDARAIMDSAAYPVERRFTSRRRLTLMMIHGEAIVVGSSVQ